MFNIDAFSAVRLYQRPTTRSESDSRRQRPDAAGDIQHGMCSVQRRSQMFNLQRRRSGWAELSLFMV